ncbi:MAG: HAD-IA family hydrolase [Chloroflexi bacterium]|nr:HAD-IA family hydrolase [Chloroflexota bacterium]
MTDWERRLEVEAIAFDLLTALIDSWTLWEHVAGDVALGRAWRRASLRLITAAGDYAPYEQMVEAAGREVGLPPERASDLLARWDELRPWPEVPDVLAKLRGRRLAIVTNCSQRLAEAAAAATGGRFEIVMSAERAGAYKTDPRAYRAALDALGLPADRVLFVAGSDHDVPGARTVGMPVYWSNRQHLPVPDGHPPLVDAPDLSRLPPLVG